LVRLKIDLPERVQMLLPVHYSVLLETPEEIRRIVVEVMEALPDGFAVPLKVAVKAGRTWAECK
jgi:DNA polymerase I-like protein with 3'-5' exonuclease and polymerase domains